jgi:hypothetical protein
MAKLIAARDCWAKMSGAPPVITLCYEVGYDAFWLARFLKARGIECLVIDPSSVQVNRRGRRVKTDRVDVKMLLRTLIRLGRHAATQREEMGEGKLDTFDFLGFTQFCTRSRKWGTFVIGRKTIKKRMRAKMQAIKMELRKKMHDLIAKTGVWIKQMLQGHPNYFAVSGNHPSLWWFFDKVKRLWLASLKRRSQTARLSWEKFIRLVASFFPPIRTLHPLPCHRFDAKTRGRRSVR